jgi:hypothetical protein
MRRYTVLSLPLQFVFPDKCSKLQGSLTEGENSVQLTFLYQLVKISCFCIANIIYSLTKQATLMRRSIVLSLTLQLHFHNKCSPLQGSLTKGES